MEVISKQIRILVPEGALNPPYPFLLSIKDNFKMLSKLKPVFICNYKLIWTL